MRPHPWNTEFSWTRPEVEPRRLTTAEIDQFHDRGFVVVENLVDPDTLGRLTGELDAIEQGVDAFLKAQPDARIMISESGAITFAPHVVKSSATARRVSRLPAIADLCHDLVGPDVRLYWDQVVYKKPEKPRIFPWHQDNGYTYVEPQQYLTVWLALTDATLENGCPWVAAGAHRLGTLAHEYLDPLGYRCFDEHPAAVAAPVPAGGAAVFSSLTPHMTGANITDEVRRSYILQYAPVGAEMLRGDPTKGPPTDRVPQSDPDRQYEVLRNGELVAD